MSVELHDLGQRLRAMKEEALVPRLMRRNVPLGHLGTVAVHIEPAGPRAVRLVARHIAPDGALSAIAAGTGTQALDALAAAVGDTATAKRLIVANRRSLRLLTSLAVSVRREEPHAELASMVMWWVDRADHPDTEAVTVAIDDCAQRFISAHPDKEESLAGWVELFGIDAADELDALVGIAKRLATDPSPPFVHHNPGDAVSFNLRGSWRAANTPKTAATRLRNRCDAADHAAELLLSDAVWQRRAAWAGEIVTGTIAPQPDTDDVFVIAQQPVCRFRAEEQVVLSVAGEDVSGRIIEVTVTNAGETLLHIDRGTNRAFGNVIIRPMPYSQPGRAAKNLADRYAIGGWPVRSAVSPPTRRRHVPLDVIVAAADL